VAALIVVASLAIGVALRDWGAGTSTRTEVLTESVAGRTEIIERTTTTETRTVDWWLLIPIGGATAATGLLILDSSRRGRRRSAPDA
jgi:hypothetical protein